MSLNPTQSSNLGWNYSDPSREGYSTSLTGTVVAIQEIQKRSFSMNGKIGAPEFWPDGNPKMNIRMTLVKADGSLATFQFQPASKAQKDRQKPSIHMDLFDLTGGTDMMNLIGKTITISTEQGSYGANNPRPWSVRISEEGPYIPNHLIPAELTQPRVLANEAASGGQINAQQAQPVQAQQPMQQAAVQPMQQAAVQQANQVAMPQTQTAINPMQPSMPTGMDPNVAAAMQAVNASNVQPVAQNVDPVYSDIPF